MKKQQLTIRDIVRLVKYKDIKRAIKYYYPKDRSDYLPVLVKLSKVRKAEPKYKKEFLTINSFKDYETLEDRNSDYYDIATNLYALSFRKWSELANIFISEDTLEHYTLEDIIAHFIWEITYYGDEAQAKKKAKELMS